MKYLITILFFVQCVVTIAQSDTLQLNIKEVDSNGKITVGTNIKDLKQDKLISGTNIKTVNSQSIIGSGNIAIAGGEAFPVGSVFLSVVSTNPATLIGYGTWEQIASGQMLVGQNSGDSDFDVAEETGGSKTKTISAGNLPQLSVTVTDPGHNHVLTELRDATTGPATTNIALTADASSQLGTKVTGTRTTGITATANTGGANTALNVVNPYFVVYVWKRTF